MKKIVLFDIDGVLLDFKKRYYCVYRDVLNRHGLKAPDYHSFVRLRVNLKSGKVFDALLPKQLQNREKVLKQCILDRDLSYEQSNYLLQDTLHPQTLKIIEELNLKGCVLGIITRRKSKIDFLKQMKFLKLPIEKFNFVEVTSNKYKSIQEIRDKFPQSEIYFITDSTQDITEVTKNPSIRIVGFPGGFETKEELKASGAKILINELVEIDRIV
jgi:phosphoglycolate phosphatase-like HAD superfamily hydrolase